MVAEREIGAGIVGFGLGGRVFHAPFLSAVPGLKLVSIMTRQVEEASQAYPRVRTTSDFLLHHFHVADIAQSPLAHLPRCPHCHV